MTTLHLIHGEAAAGGLREVRKGTVVAGPSIVALPWREPAAGAGFRETWLAAWRELGLGFGLREPGQRLTSEADRLLSALADAKHDRVEVWAGPSLDERLWLVAIARLLADAPPREVLLHDVSAEVIGHDLGLLGALDPHELDLVGRAPRPLGADERALLRRAWDALVLPTPARLVALLAEDHAPLRPLTALASRFPDARTGVSAWEHELLRVVREVKTGQGSRIIGTAMGNALDRPELNRDPWGDGTLTDRLLELSDVAVDHPLFRVSGAEGGLRTLKVELTDLGREVLDGKRCYLDLGDYTSRICGFEVDAKRPPVWVSDAGRLVTRST